MVLNNLPGSSIKANLFMLRYKHESLWASLS